MGRLWDPIAGRPGNQIMGRSKMSLGRWSDLSFKSNSQINLTYFDTLLKL